MPIRQALLEPLALSAFGHEGVVNGRVAVSEEKKRTDLSDGFVRPVTY